MSGFEAPNYTQAPNTLFDAILPEISSLAELKVTLVAVRQTTGFHKEEDEISLSRFVALTGLSRESVSEGIKKALGRGTLTRRKAGQTYLYRLQVVKNSDQSQDQSSQESRPEVVKNSDQQVVKNSDPQKKESKEKERKNEDSLRSSSASVQKPTPPDSGTKVISSKQYGIASLMDRYNRAKSKGRSPAVPDEPYKRRTGDIYAAHLKEYEPEQLEIALDKLIDCACGDGPGYLSGKKRWVPFVDALGMALSPEDSTVGRRDLPHSEAPIHPQGNAAQNAKDKPRKPEWYAAFYGGAVEDWRERIEASPSVTHSELVEVGDVA